MAGPNVAPFCGTTQYAVIGRIGHVKLGPEKRRRAGQGKSVGTGRWMSQVGTVARKIGLARDLDRRLIGRIGSPLLDRRKNQHSAVEGIDSPDCVADGEQTAGATFS